MSVLLSEGGTVCREVSSGRVEAGNAAGAALAADGERGRGAALPDGRDEVVAEGQAGTHRPGHAVTGTGLVDDAFGGDYGNLDRRAGPGLAHQRCARPSGHDDRLGAEGVSGLQ